MSELLSDEIKKTVSDKLSKNLTEPVNLIFFTMELECQSCRQTHQLLEEFVQLSDKISLTVFRFDIDKKEKEKYRIERIPAIIIKNDKDYGIRMFGLPSGYEFATLIENIIMVSTGETGIKEKNLKKISTIKKPIHIQVFVTNT